MARQKSPKGICHICGEKGPLSFEHVPPRAAFNDRRVLQTTLMALIEMGLSEERPPGRIEQRGIGYYTLCARCNNNTGAWYGKHFVDWCKQGMEILIRAGGKPSLFYMNYLFPLAVLKQITTMFFSVNGPRFHAAHPELVRFVLQQEAKFLSPDYRFFVYFNIEGRPRITGLTSTGNIHSGDFGILSEISYPPFGYVLALRSDAPDPRLFEITHFAEYDYGEFAVMELRLPVLPTHLPYPVDYRTKAQIVRDGDRNPL